MLKPNVLNTTPNGGWKYHHAFSGFTSGPFYDPPSLLKDVKAHRIANGILVPRDWEHEFWDDYCHANPQVACHEDTEVHEDQLVTQIGRGLWVELHAYAENYPDKPSDSDKKYASEWLTHWVARIPRFSKCGCRSDYDKWAHVSPPNFETGPSFRKWAEVLHDRVNQKLGKPLKDEENRKDPIFQI